MLFSAADMTGLLSSFGEPVTIDDGTVSGKVVTGVYDGPFERAAVFADGNGVESYAPRVTIKSSDADGVVEQLTRIRVAGINYLVQMVQHDRPDHTGLCSLILSEEG